jgi:NarL family two-component system response regulator LiaR
MRIVVADDHSLFRDGIVSLLDAAGFTVVGEAGDGRTAVETVLRLRPDVALMDIAMPGCTGLQSLREIRAQWPDAKVVILTVSDEDADLFEAIEAGAAGYLLKSLKADEFIEMLKGVQRGEAAMTRQTTARLMAGFSHRATSPAQDLTPRETELLQLMAQGLSNKEIAMALSLSENTVKYHLKNVLQKLGAHNRTEAAAHAIRNGILKPDISE